MAHSWKRVRSAGVFVIKKGPDPAVLVRSNVPKGHFQRPHVFELKQGENPRDGAIKGASTLGFDKHIPALRTLDIKLVYYAKEVRHDEQLLYVVVPGETRPPRGYRWAPPPEAFGSFLLSGHKRGMMRLFPKVLGADVRTLDHVPVEHRSGIVVICDFDGTVIEKEASLAILRRYAPGRWERYERPWLDKKISTHDCLGYQFTMMDASIDEMSRFAADSMTLRKGFRNFVSWCRTKGIGLVISSSGVEFYIRAILKQNGLEDVPFIADRDHWVEGLGHIAEEGLYNADCDWCGNCKLELIDIYRSRGAKIVYVGDGKTDECPCVGADLIFARATLLDFCVREEVKNHLEFETFDDVRAGLERKYGK